uniref:Putative methyltransferase n=1 Tax=viral metagenome TaxID=1070528 RepID=A0A6M3L459_9ZZZZ
MMVFIDCGFHKGEWLYKFMKIYRPTHFKVYAFEANPYLTEDINYDGIKLYKKAVSDQNCKRVFFISEESLASSSFYQRKGILYSKYITVECIDFSQWILDNLNKKDYNVLKLDVEGEEYRILEKMVKDDTISYINDMYIEFHDLKQRPHIKPEHTKEYFLKKIKKNYINFKETT